jgi:carboxylesterase
LYDPSINDPAAYLVSYSNPNPSAIDAAKPVFIAVHGFSASTFEWDEFREWTGNRADYSISQVLLGGHGSTYEAFRATSWKDWQASIIEEYDRLVTAGFTNISFIGSSAGAALLIEMLGSGFFDGKTAPRNVLMIDPFLVPSSKSLSMIHLVGPVIGYVEADNTIPEDRYWYHYRPQETLQELLDVTTRVRKQLEKGVVLPVGCSAKVYKSIKDSTADPVSAVMIFKGMTNADGSKIDVQMVESDLHVFTRLDLRETVREIDYVNQITTFADIAARGTR